MHVTKQHAHSLECLFHVQMVVQASRTCVVQSTLSLMYSTFRGNDWQRSVYMLAFLLHNFFCNIREVNANIFLIYPYIYHTYFELISPSAVDLLYYTTMVRSFIFVYCYILLCCREPITTEQVVWRVWSSRLVSPVTGSWEHRIQRYYCYCCSFHHINNK